MNYLNKIILVNSLHSYQELELKGSMHLFGEHGTGKSTLLGAIAAFYTGKLEKDIGDRLVFDCYLPQKNSWIIYEVKGNKGLFTVALNRAAASLAFYIINGDYEAEIFRQKGKANVPKKVVEAIKSRKLHFIGPIDDPSTYLSILYGTYDGKDKSELRKYALTAGASSRYVAPLLEKMLWEKPLPFSFIKKILFSLEGTEPLPIDLEQLQQGLKSFRQDQRDLRAFQASKDSASEVVQYLETLIQTETDEKELAATLSQALQVHKEQETPLKKEVQIAEKDWKDFSEQMERGRGQMHAGLKQLYQESGALSFKISEAARKIFYYQSKGIEKLLLRFEDLRHKKMIGAIQQSKSKPGEKSGLAGRDNPEQAYLLARLSKEQELRKIEAELAQEGKMIFEKIQAEKGKLEGEKELLAKGADNIWEQQKELDVLALKQTALTGKQYFDKKYKEESERIQQDIYQKLEKSLSHRLLVKQGESQLLSLQKRREGELATLAKKLKEEQETISQRLASLEEERELLISQIENSGRAFMGWLEKNYPNWQQSIGKILREEVLLSPFLNPNIERLNELFYGIQLDLSDLPASRLNLEMLQQQKEELSLKIQHLEKDLVQVRNKGQKQIETREKYYRQKYREQKRQIQKEAYALEQLQLAIKKGEARIERYQQQGIQEREALLIQLSYKETALKEVLLQAKNEQKSREIRIAQHAEKLDLQAKELYKNQENKLNEAQKKIENNWEKFYVKWEKSQKNSGSESLPEDREFYAWESLQREIFQYQHDKREYLDWQELWEMEFAGTQLQIQNLEGEMLLSKQEQRFAENSKQEKWDDARGALEAWTEAEQRWNALQETSLYSRIQSYITTSDTANYSPDTLGLILQKLELCEARWRHGFGSLKKSLQAFQAHFTPNNLFGFATVCKEEAQVKAAAAALKQFLEEDKFAEFEQTLSVKHASLISSIAEESSGLEMITDLLEKRVNLLNGILHKDLNRYISPESRFAILPSHKTLFQVLAEIRLFQQNHVQHLGGSSLFNQGDKREVNVQAMECLLKLEEALKLYPDSSFEISDTYELYLIDEQEKEQNHLPDLSPGLQRRLGISLGICLMEQLLEQHSVNVSIHLLLDRIKQFDIASLEDISKQAKKAGLKLCTASPLVPDYPDYDKLYQLSKEGGNNFQVQEIKEKIIK